MKQRGCEVKQLAFKIILFLYNAEYVCEGKDPNLVKITILPRTCSAAR
jgi:hypothetical protein